MSSSDRRRSVSEGIIDRNLCLVDSQGLNETCQVSAFRGRRGATPRCLYLPLPRTVSRILKSLNTSKTISIGPLSGDWMTRMY